MENAPLEPLTHLADGIGINNVSLFIGDQIAASDDNLLRQHKIINVLNCAVNCDINYVDELKLSLRQSDYSVQLGLTEYT